LLNRGFFSGAIEENRMHKGGRVGNPPNLPLLLSDAFPRPLHTCCMCAFTTDFYSALHATSDIIVHQHEHCSLLELEYDSKSIPFARTPLEELELGD
jgi:hypothetical protein